MKPALSGHKQLTTEVKIPWTHFRQETDMEGTAGEYDKAHRALWTCKGTFSKTSGLKPSVTLDLHHGNKTHSDLWLHGMVAKS